MRSNFYSPVVAAMALICGSVLGGAAHAQPGPSVPNTGYGPNNNPFAIPAPGIGSQPAPNPFANPAPAFGNPAAQKLLTPEALADYLRRQNYQVQLTKGVDGRPWLIVQIEQQGWKFNIDVEYTPTMNGFYVTCRLGKVGPQSPPAQLIELLKANQKYGPSYFSLWANGDLRLEDFYGSQMDTAAFQGVLNRFLARIRETQPLWDSNRWANPAFAKQMPLN